MAFTKKQKEIIEAAEKERAEFLEKNPHLKKNDEEFYKKIKAAKKKK